MEMETKQLDIVSIDMAEIALDVGISDASVQMLLKRATDAASIEATLDSHFGGGHALDNIGVDGIDGVLNKLRHVLSEYHGELSASQRDAHARRDTNVALTQEKKQLVNAKNDAEQERDLLKKQLDAIASEPIDDGPSASDTLALLKAERDELQEKCTLLETQIAKPDDANVPAPAKVQRRVQKYRLLVEAVGRKLTDMPPTIKAAYGAAIAK
jgi:hypothetical protein